MPVDVPETRYAKTADGLHIAYQIVGEGPIDLMYLAPYFSHLEINWENPDYAVFLRRLASFSRLIMYDRRGNGLSDPVPMDEPPTLDGRMDDIRAVMDVVGSERAVVYGASESGALAALFSAMHPERVVALVMYGSGVRAAWSPDYPWGQPEEEHEFFMSEIERAWGTEEFVRRTWPEMTDESLVRWLAGLSRRAMSPGAALAYERMWWGIDVRDALPTIHVPTMILHREHDSPDENRYLAEHIAGAKLIRLPGREHTPFIGDRDSVTSAIERFVRSVREEEATLDRVMAAVMFTDIVGSTEMAARLGDHAWRELVERHHGMVRSLLARYQGKEVDTAGDGFFATFDGPGRALKCATTIVEAVRPLGIQVRVGVHAGEVEMVAGKAGGIAVSIGARVGARAAPSEVLVSQTVKDLVAGSGLVFEDRGVGELKGVPGDWHLYAVIHQAA
jgi:pimeloyl-ACP methyl ester carboxylesterase/class 3 adenylate cyclase